MGKPWSPEWCWAPMKIFSFMFLYRHQFQNRYILDYLTDNLDCLLTTTTTYNCKHVIIVGDLNYHFFQGAYGDLLSVQVISIMQISQHIHLKSYNWPNTSQYKLILIWLIGIFNFSTSSQTHRRSSDGPPWTLSVWVNSLSRSRLAFVTKISYWTIHP